MKKLTNVEVDCIGRILEEVKNNLETSSFSEPDKGLFTNDFSLDISIDLSGLTILKSAISKLSQN